MHGPVFHPVTQGDLLIVSANNTEHFMLLTEQESKAFAHVPAHTCQHRTGDERPREQRLQSAPNREFLCVCGLCVLYQLHPPTACPRLLSNMERGWVVGRKAKKPIKLLSPIDPLSPSCVGGSESRMTEGPGCVS
jgi:hypothetical protein